MYWRRGNEKDTNLSSLVICMVDYNIELGIQKSRMKEEDNEFSLGHVKGTHSQRCVVDRHNHES